MLPSGRSKNRPPARAQDQGLVAAHVVGGADPRGDAERGPDVACVGDALSRAEDAVGFDPGARHRLADQAVGAGAEKRAGPRILRLPVGAAARRGAGTGRLVEPRRVGGTPAIGEEVGGLAEAIGLRRLMHEAHAVVDRQPIGRAPAVLQVALDVVVDELAFDETRLLAVGREDADRGVGERKPGVERVAGVVAEVDRALEVERGVEILRLDAVIQVEPGLGRVAPHDPGQADHDVLRRVDVQERREAEARRRAGAGTAVRRADAAGRAGHGPRQPGRQQDAPAFPERRIDVVEGAGGIGAPIDDVGVGEQRRQRGSRAVRDPRREIGRAPDRVTVRPRGHRRRAEAVLAAPVARLEVGGRAEGECRGEGGVERQRELLQRVVETGQGVVGGLHERGLPGPLPHQPQP